MGLSMEAPATPGHFSTRSRLVRSVGTLRAAVGAMTSAVGCVALTLFGKAPVLTAVFAAVLFLMSWRFWLLGIRVGPQGVNIVGLLGSRRVAWESVDHFAVGPYGGYRYVAHAVLRDGRDFACFGISAANGPNPARRRLEAQVPIDHLNAALAAWRTSASPTPAQVP
jgi:hypothetical protein